MTRSPTLRCNMSAVWRRSRSFAASSSLNLSAAADQEVDTQGATQPVWRHWYPIVDRATEQALTIALVSASTGHPVLVCLNIPMGHIMQRIAHAYHQLAVHNNLESHSAQSALRPGAHRSCVQSGGSCRMVHLNGTYSRSPVPNVRRQLTMQDPAYLP